MTDKIKFKSLGSFLLLFQIYQGDLQVNQSVVPIHIRRLLPNASVQSK